MTAVLVLVFAFGAVACAGKPSTKTASGTTKTSSEVSESPGAEPAASGDVTASAAPSGKSSSAKVTGRAGSSASGGTTGATGTVGTGVSAPGVTDTEIKVGIAYSTDPGAANSAAGFGAIGQVDQKRAWDAILKDVNKNAPFGRKVVPVYYTYTTDDVTSKGAERLYQEMCAKWTQDNKVFMAWAGGQETLQACLTKAKVPQIGGGSGFSYSKTFKDFPYYVEHNASALDRMAAFEVDQLYDAGFFKEFKNNSAPYTPTKPADGKPRIGLIRYDEPSYKAAAETMKKRLAAHGLSLCSGCEFEVSYSADNVQEQLDDATEVNAAIQNCKSRPDGPCTHMLFLGSTAGVRITLFFVDGAEKQAYRPRLGFNTLDAPAAVRDFLKDASYPQFRQSILVTTSPGDFSERPEAWKKCKKMFEDAGETFEGDQASNKENQIGGYCDDGWYFLAVLKAAGKALNLDSWMNGVHSMQPVDSATTFLMRTTATRHDGAGAIRLGQWYDDCACFKPTSGQIPV